MKKLLSILLISIANLLMTLASIIGGTGNVYQLIDVAFGANSNWANIVNIFFAIFLFICAFCTASVAVSALMISLQCMIAERCLFKAKKPKFGSLVYSLILLGIISLISFFPAFFLENDEIYSCISEVYVLIFYTIAGIVIISAIQNEYTGKVKTKIRFKLFKLFSLMAFVSILIMVVSCLIQYIYFPIISPNDINSLKNNWGLFIDGNNAKWLTNWQGALIFWVLITYLISLPLINNLLIKKWKN